MGNSSFKHKLKVLHQQVNQLKRFNAQDAAQSGELPPEAFEELLNALEELRAAEEELRQQNEELTIARQMLEAERKRYQDLFEFAPDGYLVTNAAGTIQEANHTAASLLNMHRDFLSGTPLRIFMTKEDRKTLLTQLTRLRESGRVQDWEVCLQPYGGVPFPAVITVAAVHDPQGKLIGLRWLIRDTTERKQAEEEFREVQERFSGIYNSSKDAIAYVNLEGILIDTNDSFLRLTGYSREELLNGKSYQDITPKEYHEYESQMVEKMLMTGEAVEYEKEYVRKDNSRVPILLTAFIVKNADGKPIGNAAIIKDITGHKLMEEALRRAHNELEIRVQERTEELVKANEALRAEFIERKRTEEALKEKLAQLSKKNRYETIISTVTRSVHRSINLEDVLENAVEAMSKNIEGVDNVSIYLVEGEEAVMKAYRGYPDWFIERIRRIPYPKDYTWKTIIEGKPVYCVDVDKDVIVGRVGREIGTKSYVSMPIRLGDKTVGAININSLKKNAFDQGELKLLEIVAQQIEVAINNAQQTEVLRESEERFRNMADTAPAMIWMAGTDKLCTYFNKGWLEFTGRTMEQELGYGWTEGVHPDDMQCCLDTYVTAFDTRRDFKMEYRLRRFDGKYRWILDHGTPRFLPDGSFTGYIGSCLDITNHKQVEEVLQKAKDELEIRVEERTTELRSTNKQLQLELGERKRAEEQLKASLKEKEVLLKEVHHRVKNNLQVISSLLDLQSQYVKHRKTLSMFNESQNRVKSMALIHEILYQSKDLSRINFAEYIRNLGDYLFQSYGANSNGIRLKIDIYGVLLSVNTAIVCGLIINELVSNSLKYAFPKSKEGEIRINLRSDNKKYTLIVSDNGVGFPKGLDFRNTESLGLQLVMALTNQLGGAIKLNRSRGTEFKVKFTEPKYKERN